MRILAVIPIKFGKILPAIRHEHSKSQKRLNVPMQKAVASSIAGMAVTVPFSSVKVLRDYLTMSGGRFPSIEKCLQKTRQNLPSQLIQSSVSMAIMFAAQHGLQESLGDHPNATHLSNWGAAITKTVATYPVVQLSTLQNHPQASLGVIEAAKYTYSRSNGLTGLFFGPGCVLKFTASTLYGYTWLQGMHAISDRMPEDKRIEKAGSISFAASMLANTFTHPLYTALNWRIYQPEIPMTKLITANWRSLYRGWPCIPFMAWHAASFTLVQTHLDTTYFS